MLALSGQGRHAGATGVVHAVRVVRRAALLFGAQLLVFGLQIGVLLLKVAYDGLQLLALLRIHRGHHLHRRFGRAAIARGQRLAILRD